MPSVKFRYTFDRAIHIGDWIASINELDQNAFEQRESKSEGFDEYNKFEKKNGGLMDTFTIELDLLQGGCPRGDAAERVVKGDAYTFKLKNLPFCDNNCGLVCIQDITSKSFSCTAEKKY